MSRAKKARKGVTVHNEDKAYKGYTLIAAECGYNAWLINMKGEVVHHWPLDHLVGLFARLLPNGNLMYQGMEEENPGGPMIEVKDANGKIIMKWAAGGNQYLKELDDDYNIVWQYEDPLLNHDFYPQENGNIMLTKYTQVPDELKSKTKQGIPVSDDTPMWCDKLEEIDRDGNLLWDWNSYEHLDFEKDVYCPVIHRYEWTHMNTCTVMPDGNVLGSFRTLDLICVIDKKTKKVTWRYGQGDGELAQPHEPTVLENGNILVFDNGEYRRYSTKYSYSRVVEIDPKTNKIVWEYKDDPPFAFYSGNQCGAQRLPNGNTLICESLAGRVFEVSKQGEVVWEYMSPFYGPHAGQEPNPIIYRAYRVGVDTSYVQGKDLDPGKYRWMNEIFGPEALKSDI